MPTDDNYWVLYCLNSLSTSLLPSHSFPSSLPFSLPPYLLLFTSFILPYPLSYAESDSPESASTGAIVGGVILALLVVAAVAIVTVLIVVYLILPKLRAKRVRITRPSQEASNDAHLLLRLNEEND